jgi:hypothetical protein
MDGCAHCGSMKGYGRTYGRCVSCGELYKRSGLGTLPVEPVITGTWPFAGFPPVVQLNGVTFNAATWAWPYSGVVSQYRQDVANNAMHLLVYRDGQYVIRHMDEISPDPSSGGPGRPLEHAVVDAPLATTIVCGLAGLGLGLVAGLLLFREPG